MKHFQLLVVALCALGLACGETSSTDDTMEPQAGTTGQGGAAGSGTEPAVEATSMSLSIASRATDGEMGRLAGANIFIEPFSSPEAANPQPHVYFTRAPDGVTDAEGNVTVSVTAGERHVVHIVADGYGSLMRLIEPNDKDQLFFILTLQELHRTTINLPEEGEIQLVLGDTMGGRDALVTLNIEAGDLAYNTDSASSALRLKQAGDDAAVSGEIEVLFQAWDPFTDDGSSMPSDLATDTGPIASYGMFSIEFLKDGVPVNVTEGQTVGWDMELNEAFASQAKYAAEGDHLNVYSMDGGAGLWVEDEVTKSYDADTRTFSAESTHFSHKNCDDPGPYNCNGCVEVAVVNECGDAITQNINVQVSGSSSGNSLGCHNLPDALDNPSTPKTKDGSASVSVRNPRTGQVISDSQAFSTMCNDGGLTGCGTGSCAAASFTVDVFADAGEACSTRDDCGCESDGIGEGLSCIDGSCQACLGSDEGSRANDSCESNENCCRAAANNLGVDLICEDSRCVAPL